MAWNNLKTVGSLSRCLFVATVSRALNKKRYVSEKSTKKVEAAYQRIGFLIRNEVAVHFSKKI